MLYFTELDSPIGKLTVVSDGEFVNGLYIEGQKLFLDTLTESPRRDDSLPIFDTVRDWLSSYWKGNAPEISRLPLKPYGNEFRMRVWEYLCLIPYGTVTTYGEIAKLVASDLGKKTMSAQAVGGAVGHNPISIIIPCHRVIGSNGKLTGYAGGLDKKLRLLTHENADPKSLYIPDKLSNRILY